MPVTIRDIARAAGVSKAAVSYVINGKPGVGEETRRKILRIMEEMKFHPNAMARGLAGRSTGMLGLVIPDITDMFYASIIRGVEAKANDFGYTLTLCTTHGRREKEESVVDVFTSGRVDGVILMTYYLDGEYFNELKGRGIPFVTIDNPPPDESIYSIMVDNEEAGYRATDYLARLGHRRIAFIHGPEDSVSSGKRFRGYLRALEDHGIPFCEGFVGRGDFLKAGGYTAAKALLALDTRPTAVFAANDQMAIGALGAASDWGMRVPEDVSIIGVDDIEAAALVKPPLTTLRQPTYEMGSMAVEILLSLIRGEEPEPRRISLHAELVVRGSCAACTATG